MMFPEDYVNDKSIELVCDFKMKLIEYEQWKTALAGMSEGDFGYDEYRKQKLKAYEEQLYAFGALNIFVEQFSSCLYDYRWN